MKWWKKFFGNQAASSAETTDLKAQFQDPNFQELGLDESDILDPEDDTPEDDTPEDEEEDQEVLAQELEYLEDLSFLEGRILPQLLVPDWRQELEFVKERYEPCDLNDHIVKVSKRRLTAKRIDHEIAKSRVKAYERYLERASRRFKSKVDEDAVLNEAIRDLMQWKSDQSRSVAWKLADRVNQEVLKAKSAEIEATSFIQKNNEFSNPEAAQYFRKFARKLVLIPLFGLYMGSVVALTYNKFDWILKFLPFFNLGLEKALIMVAGVAGGFWLSTLWRYSKYVAKTQKQLLKFIDFHSQQHERIKHAVSEHTRLSQQKPLVEPILKVMAKGYRVQLQSDVSMKAQVTTQFDPSILPACVTLARAVDTDERKMKELRNRAQSILMSTGWRTRGLDHIAKIHAESTMLDSNSLSLASLDTYSVASASNAQKLLLEAFSNNTIHERVSRERLIRAIRDLHSGVLANFTSQERPRVISMRDDGFDKIAFRSSWLEEEDSSEDWITFLEEILTDETAPFGQFNILDKNSNLNKSHLISSIGVVPHYFPTSRKFKIKKSTSKEVLPMDVVVRVDVSPWADPSSFAVFANSFNQSIHDSVSHVYTREERNETDV